MPLKKRKPINDVLAESLRFWMKRMGYEGQQVRLAKASGVSQRTISNYLNPHRRLHKADGKLPSAKLVEVELVADALNVAVWELLRAGSAAERDAYHETEDLIRRIGARASSAPEPLQGEETETKRRASSRGRASTEPPAQIGRRRNSK